MQKKELDYMDYKKSMNEINDIISKGKENLNILEDQVDLKTQKEYFQRLHDLDRNRVRFDRLTQEYRERVEDIFNMEIPQETRENMLTVIATINDVAIYRAIEKLSKSDDPIKNWAIVAKQQSRMVIHSSLLDEPGIFISTGLGGQGSRLRYFCVIFFIDKKIEHFQTELLKKEIQDSISKKDGVVEDFISSDKWVTVTTLLSISIDLKDLFLDIITECNQYGEFLQENMIITNVKRLNNEEIETLVKNRK